MDPASRQVLLQCPSSSLVCKNALHLTQNPRTHAGAPHPSIICTHEHKLIVTHLPLIAGLYTTKFDLQFGGRMCSGDFGASHGGLLGRPQTCAQARTFSWHVKRSSNSRRHKHTRQMFLLLIIRSTQHLAHAQAPCTCTHTHTLITHTSAHTNTNCMLQISTHAHTYTHTRQTEIPPNKHLYVSSRLLVWNWHSPEPPSPSNAMTYITHQAARFHLL